MQIHKIVDSDEKIASTSGMAFRQVNKCLSVVLHSYLRKMQKYPKEIHLFQSDESLQIVDVESMPLFSFADKASIKEIHALLLEFQRVPFVLAFNKLYRMVSEGYESHNRICLISLLNHHQLHLFPWPWKIGWDRKKIFCAESSLLFSLPDNNNCFEQDVLEDIIALKASANPQKSSLIKRPQRTGSGTKEVVIY